jgi:carbon monoxide dehydrogenase subunit G
MIKSALYLPASRARVFGILTDYAKYTQWLPGCEQCVVVSSQGAFTKAEIVLVSPRRLEATLHFESRVNEAIQYQMTGAKEIKTYAGVYRLSDAADGRGTVLFSELELEARSIPRFVSDGIAKKALKDSGEALKRYIERLPAERTAAQPTAAAPAPKRRRARRLLQIVKTSKGYRVSLMGADFPAKSIPGNFFEG